MSAEPAEQVEETTERESLRSSAKFFGDRIEEYACERFGLILDRSTEFDARFPESRDPYQDHAGEFEQLRGTKIQIKGCMEWIKCNGSRRRGRYRLWLPDHLHLCREDGVYLFHVYDPRDMKPVFATRFVRARELDDLVGGIRWYDAQHSTKRGKPTDINHRRIFDPEVKP